MKKLLILLLMILPMMAMEKKEVKKQAQEPKVMTILMCNGYVIRCDVPGCIRTASNIWYDSESGCRSFRCDKHK